MTLQLEDIEAAAARIKPYVLRTPTLKRRVGNTTLHLKAESLQPIGAFKLRGAFNVMTQLAPDCPGVVAHSSGNHAQAVARAASVLGIRAVIVMPDNAPPLKRARTEADGAEVIIVGPDSNERAERAAQIAAEEGLVPVSPYNDLGIAAGQGTAALELLEDSGGTLQRFYAPVSGGGLMAGCAVALCSLTPEIEIVAVEPQTKPSLQQSLLAGERVAVPPPPTIADGLRVRVPGEVTWPILKHRVTRSELVSDEELKEAMVWALSECRLVLEPSGAASLAVALRECKTNSTAHMGVLLSGGNVDPNLFAEISQRAAVGA